MSAAPGSVVGLYVDLVAIVTPGDVIETQSGRRYGVESVRVQMRGKHHGRQHLRATVLEQHALVPPGATVHTIRWYARGRGRK